MEKSNEMLSHLYKNVKMGSESITSLLPKVNNDKMLSDLTTQLVGYESFATRASEMLANNGVKPEDDGFFKKIPLKTGITMNTAFDSSASHIAEMMIQGSNMGIIETTKEINAMKNQNCSGEAMGLAGEFVTFEQNNIERLKAYL